MDDYSRMRPMEGLFMNKTIHFIIFLLFISCGYKPDFINNDYPAPYTKAKSHSDFNSYIAEFEIISKKKVNVPIIYGELDLSYAGVCTMWSDGYREIKINRVYWLFYSDAQKEILVFHELGHCVLGLKHNDTKSSGCPASIMRSYLFSVDEAQDCYDNNRLFYLEEITGE